MENAEGKNPSQEEPVEQKPPNKKKDPREKLYKPDHQPFVLTSSPHDYQKTTVPKIMWSVIAALVPASAASLYYFGIEALWLIIACTLSAAITEAIINLIKKEESTLLDGSAVITGLLLALTLPPSLPITSAIFGSVFAIAIGKQIFGGLGFNIFNPALVGRAFLQAAFPVAMTTWTFPQTLEYAGQDAVTAATPLGLFKFEKVAPDYYNLLTGNIGGSLGETSALAILAGGLFLLLMKYADWRIPTAYLGTVFVVGGAFYLMFPGQYPDPLFHILSGGVLLGAFFMATDMVTSPITPRGSWIFGICAGILLIIIRLFGGLPEGVMYSILLMNAFTPLINRLTRPRFLGEVKA